MPAKTDFHSPEVSEPSAQDEVAAVIPAADPAVIPAADPAVIPAEVEILRPPSLPKLPAVKYDQRLFQVPVPPLQGEQFYRIGETVDGLVALSNYRVVIKSRRKLHPVPLGIIDRIQVEEGIVLMLETKHGHIYRCRFNESHSTFTWYELLVPLVAVDPKLKLENMVLDSFARYFHAYTQCPELRIEQELPWFLSEEERGYNFTSETERLGLVVANGWKYFEGNNKYQLCDSYPSEHRIPAEIDAEAVKSFRTANRFISVVWRHQRHGAVLMRSSQPEVGLLINRSTNDEAHVQCVVKMCRERPGSEKTNLVIIDARSYAAALANRIKGGGFEFSDYYPNCDICFEGLGNIHYVRTAMASVRTLCHTKVYQPNPKFLSALEASEWLLSISSLLKSSWRVAYSLHCGKPVLVHCTDGWDRTSQLVSLAQLILDPYYRSCQGFRILIEREWLAYGHKFNDRSHGHSPNDRCPVFLQWLDCVNQLREQYPTEFEFNETFLLKLVYHVYSKLFGTFLLNNERQRKEQKISENTLSIWKLLNKNNKNVVQALYSPETKVLRPLFAIQYVRLWTRLFLLEEPENKDEEVQQEVPAGQPPSAPSASGLNRSHSMDDISLQSTEDVSTVPLTRQLSDPSLAGDAALEREGLRPTGSAKELMEGVGGKERGSEVRRLSDNPASASSDTLVGDETLSYTTSECSIQSDPNVVPSNLGQSQSSIQFGTPAASLSQPVVHKETQVSGQSEPEVPTAIKIPVETGSSSFPDISKANNNNKVLETPQNGIFRVEKSTSTVAAKPGGSALEDNEENGVNSVHAATMHPAHLNGSGETCDTGVSAVAPGDNNEVNGILAGNHSQENMKSCEHRSDIRVIRVAGAQTDPPSHTVPVSYTLHGANGSRHNALPTAIDSLPAPDHPSAFCVDKLSAHMSTSTTDISDSSVIAAHRANQGNARPRLNGHTVTPPIVEVTEVSRHVSYRENSNGSSSPSSEKIHDPFSLDVDGLERFEGVIEAGLQAREEAHTQEVQRLHEVYTQRIRELEAMYTKDSWNNGLMYRYLESGVDDHNSLSGQSTTSTDTSYDKVEAQDAGVPMWMPDNLVKACAACECAFNLWTRKHHCRNCGKIFCSSCSSHMTPLPHQLSAQEERVCDGCFNLLGHSKSAIYTNGKTKQSW